MLVSLQRLAEGPAHDKIVFLRDIRIDMAGGSGERQLGVFQIRHDIQKIFLRAPALGQFAR